MGSIPTQHKSIHNPSGIITFLSCSLWQVDKRGVEFHHTIINISKSEKLCTECLNTGFPEVPAAMSGIKHETIIKEKNSKIKSKL